MFCMETWKEPEIETMNKIRSGCKISSQKDTICCLFIQTYILSFARMCNVQMYMSIKLTIRNQICIHNGICSLHSKN